MVLRTGWQPGNRNMRKGYIFTDKKISNRAVMAVILGVISLVAMGVVIFLAYVGKGEIAVKYGIVGLLSGIYSLIGLGLGIITVFDKNYYKLFPVLGIVLNLAGIACVGLVLYMGVS